MTSGSWTRTTSVACFSSAWLLNQPSFSSCTGWTMTTWPLACRPAPSARADVRGWMPGPSMIRIFMASPLPCAATSGGLGLDRPLVEVHHALRQFRVGDRLQFVLQLRVQLEDFSRELTEDFRPPNPARLGEVVAVGAVGVAR